MKPTKADYQSVIQRLLEAEVPVRGFWYGVDEDACPRYKHRALTPGEAAVLVEVAAERDDYLPEV